MKKLLIILITLCGVSCNSAIHETEYEVKFTDGTTTIVVGYSVTTINNHYVVKSVNNNSIFDKSKVVGIYPKDVGYIWNPINELVMIHEEICTYEVCKLAKEKGFNVQTFDWYDYTGNYNKGFIPHKLHECPRYKEYYAPTQSLLQRLLREEKDIDIAIVPLYTGGYSYIVYNIHCRDNRVVNTNAGYATYELALEDALKYALENLI